MLLRPRASDRARTLAVKGLAITAVAGCAALALGVLPAQAAPVVTTTGAPVSYVEQAAPVTIGSGVTVAGGGQYGGGYVDFAVDGASAAETLSLLSVATASTASGVVSVVGSTVYIGTGTRADVVGTVNPSRAGANGALRVDLATQFTNPSFESITGSTIAGWTSIQSRIDLGVTQIAGFTSQDASTYFPGQVGQPVNDDVAPDYATYSVTRNSSLKTEGAYSLQLSSDMGTARGCDVVHGPGVFSEPFSAAAGDTIGFDWRAYQGSDDYHVFGYILNVATGQQTTVLDATGGNTNAWISKNTTVPTSGKYRFVFVAGTHDLTCGQAAGATLLLDNVRVQGATQAQATDAVVTQIAQKLQYANSSDNPATSRTVKVTAADQSGVSNTGTISVAITPVDDDPVFSAIPSMTLTNTDGPQTFAPIAGTLPVTDPDSTGLTYSITGGTADPATVNGVAYTHSKAGRYGVLRLNSATGQYVLVPDSAAADARQTDDSESFTLGVSSPDQSSGGAAKTAQQTLTVKLDVPETGPGATSATLASAGIRTAAVSWTAPTWIGGSAITGYRIQTSTDGTTWTTAVESTGTTATNAQLTGLAAGQQLQVRVAGINATGVGTYGTASAALTPYDVPEAPQTLSATPKDRRVDLDWTAPASDNGRAVSGYRVQYSVDGGATWTTASADTGSAATHFTVTGLTNGQAATFRLAAWNLAGAGADSATAAATPRTVPGAVTVLTATPGDEQVDLSWNAPFSDGGAPITGYRIETSDDGGATWTTAVADTASTATTATLTGLVNGVRADYRVSALNAAGAGAASESASTAPRRAATAPVIDSIAPSNRTLLVSFTAPTDDGGAAITGYEYSVDGGTTWHAAPAGTAGAAPAPVVPLVRLLAATPAVSAAAGGAGTPLRITGLINGTEYPVLVRAVNAAGPGASSNVEPGTPVLEPVRTEDSTSSALPDQSAGTASSSLNGAGGAATLTRDGDAIVVTAGGASLRIVSYDASGAVVRPVGGTLSTVRGGTLRITGSGYQPGSTLDLWMLRSGTLLDGAVPVGADGSFGSTIAIASAGEFGVESLQLNGVDPDGDVLSLAVGVDVISQPAAVAAALAVTGTDAVGGLVAALALLGAGAGLLVVRRARRSRSAA